MTSEKMNRAIEFILQHQAQVSIQLEELAKNQIHHNELLGQMAIQGQRFSSMFEIQSRRLDRAEREDRAAQKRHEQLMEELRERLDRIFDKLS